MSRRRLREVRAVTSCKALNFNYGCCSDLGEALRNILLLPKRAWIQSGRYVSDVVEDR